MKTSASVAIAATLLSSILAGCGAGSSESLLASAKASLAKHDTKAAIIQSKNALQASPNLAEARYLLGAALLEARDPTAAELELRKAQSLGFSPDLVAPKLAAVLLAQGKYKKLIEDYGNAKPQSVAAKADLDTSLAYAYSVQGDKPASEAALNAALAADQAFAPALIARARFTAAAGDSDGALSRVDEILKQNPANAEAWRLKGDILTYLKSQPDNGLVAYRKALEVNPDFPGAHLAILSILLQQRKVDEADKQLANLRKLTGGNAQVTYVEAMIAYLRKDMQKARQLSQQLLKIAPDSPNILLLAGGAELEGGSLVQAQNYLEHTIQLAPYALVARRMLITAYLRSGQTDKAVAVLRPGHGVDDVPPALYAVAGEAYLQSGDVKTAEEYFTKATKIDPKNAGTRTSLALAHLQGGEGPLAFTELQDIAASDSGTAADLALITARMQRGEFDKALVAIDALEHKRPDQPLSSTLRGRAQLSLHDEAGARKSFEHALMLSPGYFPAIASLAAIDVSQGKPKDARKRMDNFLAGHPGNSQALMTSALLPGTSNEEATAILNKAVVANPSESGPRLLLIQSYLANGNQQQALVAAQNAMAALPDQPEIVEALGKVQQASGDSNQAMTAFSKLAELQPRSPSAYLRLADAQLQAGDKDGAADSLRKGLAIKPDQFELQRKLAGVAIASGKFDDALGIAHSVQHQRPTEAVGYLLEGDVQSTHREWGKAVSAYRAGLQRAPSSSELAVKLHSVLAAAGDDAGARKLETAWRTQHPDDATFLFHMGDTALLQKDYPSAKTAYLAVIKLQPENAAAFNNLAWVANAQGDDGALRYAEKANELSPNQPAFMDTLATILMQSGKYDRAIALQKKAVELTPSNNGFKLNLAKLYLKSGNKSDARRELTRLSDLGAKFPGQAEVSSLLKSL